MGPRDRVRVGPARFGLGVFAARAVRAGEVILSFTGPRFSGAALEARGFRPGYPLQVERDVFVELDLPGVLVNHGCDPNTGLTGALELIALAAIAPGEELLYDYSTTMLEDDQWSMRCGCGAPICRGEVRDFPRLPPERQRVLLAAGVVLPFIVAELRARGPLPAQGSSDRRKPS